MHHTCQPLVRHARGVRSLKVGSLVLFFTQTLPPKELAHGSWVSVSLFAINSSYCRIGPGTWQTLKTSLNGCILSLEMSSHQHGFLCPK